MEIHLHFKISFIVTLFNWQIKITKFCFMIKNFLYFESNTILVCNSTFNRDWLSFYTFSWCLSYFTVSTTYIQVVWALAIDVKSLIDQFITIFYHCTIVTKKRSGTFFIYTTTLIFRFEIRKFVYKWNMNITFIGAGFSVRLSVVPWTNGVDETLSLCFKSHILRNSSVVHPCEYLNIASNKIHLMIFILSNLIVNELTLNFKLSQLQTYSTISQFNNETFRFKYMDLSELNNFDNVLIT